MSISMGEKEMLIKRIGSCGSTAATAHYDVVPRGRIVSLGKVAQNTSVLFIRHIEHQPKFRLVQLFLRNFLLELLL